MHTINYNHQSQQTAPDMDTALDMVRTAMIQCRQSATGADDMVEIEVEDGVYCYYDQEDADRDDTGARAFAHIAPAKYCHQAEGK